MTANCELSHHILRRNVDISSMGFGTTADLECLSGLIGQDRAVKSVNFGLSVNSKGYNLFVVGNPGSGRTTYTLEKIRELAATMPAPDDWVYLYNFDEPQEPLAVNLPAGMGRDLSRELDEKTEELKVVLSKAFDNNQYEDSKAQLVKEFQEKVNRFMEELRAWAGKRDFVIKRTPQGFVNLPMIREKDEAGEDTVREMQQEEFEKLSSKVQSKLHKISENISQRTLDTLRQIREHEKTLKDHIKALESEICNNATRPLLTELKEKFGVNESISAWLEELAQDITDNFNVFIAAARDENAEIDFSRYSINVLVSNDPEGGAPVIRETNPTYYNIVGKVEYESRQGYLYTDFSRIVSGAMHRANGGYLILEADDLLRQFMSWDALKRVISTGELAIENLGEQLGYVPVSSLRPSPIPISVKVVVVGTRWLYHLLNIYDPEFQKVFKVKADFDSDMPRDNSTEHQLACFVSTFVEREGKRHFTADAVAEVIEWASRAVESQERMSTQFNQIAEVLVESTAWAKAEESEVVHKNHVRKALDEKNFRANLMEERLQRAYEDGTIRIDTCGTAIGQINGLSVIDMVDHTFGHPSRITANVFMGQDGIINIEREVKLTGPIHNKGLMILQSYLGRKYATDMTISMSARITFEQTYSGIEGDSASSTELYCLLSAISEVPLRQDIAVTGSVDQFGNIQPIGGVNEKIEGFFRYCRVNGLTGTQGVMIPAQNKKNLMLNHEVVEAVEDGKFHIWAISTIDQGIEILTGEDAGEPGTFEECKPDSVHGKVKCRMKAWMQRSSDIKKLIDGEDEAPKENKPKKKRDRKRD